MDFKNFLYGSEPDAPCGEGSQTFLSCLYGSEHTGVRTGGRRRISKLPVRQWTLAGNDVRNHVISKLPVRQWTTAWWWNFYWAISKLPVRQWTRTFCAPGRTVFSKLPVRQWTEIIADYPIDLLLKITKSQVHTLFRDVKIVINKINELHVTLKNGSIGISSLSYFPRSFW